MLTLACIIAILVFVYILVRQYANRTDRRRTAGVSESKYARMTTNERLVAAGLFRQFAAAARDRDVDAMVEILQHVEIARADCQAIAEAIVADPQKYGF
jgi:hypothetical protein